MAMKLWSIFMAVCVFLLVAVLLKLALHQQEFETKQQVQPLQKGDASKVKELQTGAVVLNQSCCSVAVKYKVDYLCSREISSLVSHCSCSDYLMCKLVMVTALSSSHFVESIDFFGSVHTRFPQVMIIVYDLGLTRRQVSRIQSYCNVLEVRKFNFNRYPSHAKNLYNYAWKVFILSEISEEHEVFFYCDTSCRVKSIIPHYLPKILKFPVLPASWIRHSVVKTTHDGMLKYLGVRKSREELEQLLPHGFQGGANIFWANAMFKEKLLPSLTDCASHLECITPEGSHKGGCDLSVPGYAGCHRYDQSALNILLLRDFGDALATLYKELSSGGKPVNLVDIQRHPTTQYNNSMSHHCNILYAVPEEPQVSVAFVLQIPFMLLIVIGICKLKDYRKVQQAVSAP